MFEQESNKTRWLWVTMVLSAVVLVLFWVWKKSKKNLKRQSDTNSCDYLTTGDECIACCGSEKECDNHTSFDQM